MATKWQWRERAEAFDLHLQQKASERLMSKREKAQDYLETSLLNAAQTMAEIWEAKDLKAIPLQLQKFGLQIGREKGMEALEKLNKILNPQLQEKTQQQAIVINFPDFT